MPSVIGIFPNHDAVSNLAYEVKKAGLDSRDLTIIGNDDPIGFLRSTAATFVRRVSQPDEPPREPPTRIFGDVDWEFPVREEEPPPTQLIGDPQLEALSDLGVPDGRTGLYLKAIETGSWVVGFNAGDRADVVRVLFTSAQGKAIDLF